MGCVQGAMMGLFDKLKSGIKGVADRVTGGYGEATLSLEEQRLKPGESLKGKLRVEAKAELKVTAIYLTLEGVETSSFSTDQEDGCTAEAYQNRRETLKVEETLGEECQLAEGESKEWDFEITLPEDAAISYDGESFKHEYKLKAQVDVPWGVDLRVEEDVTVVNEPPEEKKNLNFEGHNNVVYMKLNFDKEWRAGEKVNYSIKLAGMNQSVKINGYKLTVTGTESVKCKIMEPSGEEDGKKLRPGVPEWVAAENHFEWETEKEAFEIAEGRFDMSMSVINLPEDLKPTYESGSFKNDVSVRLEVQWEGGDPLLAGADLQIFPAKAEG